MRHDAATTRDTISDVLAPLFDALIESDSLYRKIPGFISTALLIFFTWLVFRRRSAVV
jgi:hypothetical protein